MINIFDRNNNSLAGNGNAVLTPIQCSHRQAAAGKYDLTIVHPLDPTGKWKHIVEEAVIRAPVPEETIETAYSGMDVDVYKTNTDTALRSGMSEPSRITYTAWAAGTTYNVGDKVTYSNKNYKCTVQHIATVVSTPESRPNWWTRIADYSSGAPVIVNLKSGTELYFIEDEGSGWYKMSTAYGMEGYIKSSNLTYDRHLSPTETQPRTITTQLFRIKTVSVDTRAGNVTATAEHVSYDLNGVLIKDANISKRNPAMTLALIEQQFMIDYEGMIATDMTSDSDGEYTGEIKGKSGTYAILDPDKGVVSTFGAMYRRDNWDLFVLRKVNTDRGFELRYRKNILGANWSRKSDSLVTRVVPIAKAEDGSDLYLDGTEWVDSPLINNYPKVRMEWLRVNGQVGKDDGTETGTTWTETTLRAEMAAKAAERFSVDNVDKIIHEITVDFEMLGDTEEYRALRKLENVLMYDTVKAINEEIGLSVTAEVVEIEYDCIRGKVTGLKLSNVNAYGGKNVSGFNVLNNSITGDKLTDEAGEAIAGAAVDEAVSESKGYTDNEVVALRNWVNNNFQPIS